MRRARYMGRRVAAHWAALSGLRPPDRWQPQGFALGCLGLPLRGGKRRLRDGAGLVGANLSAAVVHVLNHPHVGHRQAEQLQLSGAVHADPSLSWVPRRCRWSGCNRSIIYAGFVTACATGSARAEPVA